MEYTKEQIQEMAKIEANDKKHEHIKLDYQDGIYYGFKQGFEKALSLFAVSDGTNNKDRKTYLVSYVKKREPLFTTESIETKIVFVDEDDYKDAYSFIEYIVRDLVGYSGYGITIISLSEIPVKS